MTQTPAYDPANPLIVQGDRTLLLEGGVAKAIGPTDEIIDFYRQREMVG